MEVKQKGQFIVPSTDYKLSSVKVHIVKEEGEAYTSADYPFSGGGGD